MRLGRSVISTYNTCTYRASLCVCRSWGRRAEWAINCAWFAFHTESNSWGMTRYSVERINFIQISLFPFFLHPMCSLLRSLFLLFSACLSLLSSFFSLYFLFPLSFVSFSLIFYLLSSLIFFRSFSFLFVSFSLFLYHFLPFVFLLCLLFRFFVYVCKISKNGY